MQFEPCSLEILHKPSILNPCLANRITEQEQPVASLPIASEIARQQVASSGKNHSTSLREVGVATGGVA